MVFFGVAELRIVLMVVVVRRIMLEGRR